MTTNLFLENGDPHEIHTFTDDKGESWFEFTCSYDDREGKKFCFSIWAKSIKDAEERMESLRSNAKVDGQLFCEIDADTKVEYVN